MHLTISIRFRFVTTSSPLGGI